MLRKLLQPLVSIRNVHDKWRRTSALIHSRICRFEPLELRCLFAVGSFERVDGNLTVAATAQAIGDPSQLVSTFDNNNTVLSHESATAIATDDGSISFAHSDGTALVPTPIGSNTSVPQVNAAIVNQVMASGPFGEASASSEHVTGVFGNSAQASFTYTPDPEFSENLVLHQHFFLGGAAGIADDAVGSGGHVGVVEVLSATINGATVRAEYMSPSSPLESGLWTVTFNGLSGFEDFTVADEVNLHIHVEVPFAGSAANLRAVAQGEAGANNFDTYDDTVEGMGVGTATAWVYVTGEGDDLDPGDFNGDGNVNVHDFDLLVIESPLADGTGPGGTPDGVINIYDYELWATNATDVLIVSSQGDGVDGDYTEGELTLREALLLAADEVNHPGLDAIVFAPWVQEIDLTNGELVIDSDVDIHGLGLDELTIDAQGNNRVFHRQNGASVDIRGLTITGGDATVTNGYGGGIYSSGSGSLSVTDVRIVNNLANFGGGIFHNGDALDVERSSILSNQALTAGGGLGSGGSSVQISESTIAYNSSAGVA